MEIVALEAAGRGATVSDSDNGSSQPGVPGADEDFHFLAYPANLLVSMFDEHGLCDFVSPSWLAFTGRDDQHEMGTGWLDRVHSDDRPVLAHRLGEARQTRQPFHLLFRYEREDGAQRWLMMRGFPRGQAGREFLGHIAICFDVTAYQLGDAELERAAQHMIFLLRQTRLIGVVLDVQGRIRFSNGGLCRLLKYSGVELINSHLFGQHLHEQNLDLLQRLYPDGTQNANFPTEFDSELLTRDGESRQVLWHAMILRDDSGRVSNTILIGDDVTELRRDEAQVALTAKIFNATHHAMVITDLDAKIIAVNDAFTNLTGYQREEVTGQNPRVLKSARHNEAFYEQMWAQLLESGHWHGDIWDRRKDGSVYPKYLSISTIKDAHGNPTHYSAIFYDISERKTIEERLDRLAHYDSLTGLPNRSLLFDRIEEAVKRAVRFGNKVALLYLDLDHFKEVNDTLGHSVGDELLKAASQRVKVKLRAADTMARLGGDEFVVLLPDLQEIGDVSRIAKLIVDELSTPFELEGHTVSTSPSIGISVFPDDGDRVDQLIKSADQAMYRVKQSGRADFAFSQNVETCDVQAKV